jgi:hypothetical protein
MKGQLAMTEPERLHAGQRGAIDGLRTIYVASSWSNQLQPRVVEALRSQGHHVYDFKYPDGTPDRGFRWTDTDLEHANPVDGEPPAIGLVSAADYVAALTHPAAMHGFQRDFNAMVAADTFVLVLPCGRSAHLELGWAVGAGKRTAILLDDPCTPELMYKMVDRVSTGLDDLVGWLAHGPAKERRAGLDCCPASLQIAPRSASSQS